MNWLELILCIALLVVILLVVIIFVFIKIFNCKESFSNIFSVVKNENVLKDLYKNQFKTTNINIPTNIKNGYALVSGPEPEATSAWKGIDKTPTIYLFGGVLTNDKPNMYIWILRNGKTNFEKHGIINIPMTNCKGTYIPQYGKTNGPIGLIVLISSK